MKLILRLPRSEDVVVVSHPAVPVVLDCPLSPGDLDPPGGPGDHDDPGTLALPGLRAPGSLWFLGDLGTLSGLQIL